MFLKPPQRGWRAVLWHVCASLMLKRRIHPDNERRDVYATHGSARPEFCLTFPAYGARVLPFTLTGRRCTTSRLRLRPLRVS